jgi:WD40 repeat protein
MHGLGHDCRCLARRSVLPRTRGLVVHGVVGLIALLSAVRASAEAPSPGPATKDYAHAITQAQAELDAGRIEEARKLLADTDESPRSFEYAYLLARARSPAADGAVPDLVRHVALPDVESRYGVLNQVNRQLVFICRDGGLRIHDLNKPEAEPRKASSDSQSAIWSGAFSWDGTTFAAGHENGHVLVWDAQSWTVRHDVSLGEEWPVRELAVAHDGSSFVAESKAALQLWSLSDGAPRKVADVGERYTFGEGLAFSPRGDLIATGGMFDIELHDARSGELKHSMRHASYTMGLEFSPNGDRVASAPRGNVNKFLSVFDIASGDSLFIAGPFENYVAGLAFTPDGARVAATGPQQDVRLFDAVTGEVVLTLKRAAHTAKPSFSRDGQLLGWSQPDGYHYIDLGQAIDAP